MSPDVPKTDLSAHYRRLLSRIPARRQAAYTESSTIGDVDLSDQAIRVRLAETRAALNRIVTDYLGGDGALRDVVDQIVAQGDEGLRAVGAGDDNHLTRQPGLLAAVEAVVRTDGSRPSFLIRNGSVDRATSILGDWGDKLTSSAGLLGRAIACVGRIDLPGSSAGFEGTGFLVHPDLIMTNRHVLQLVADYEQGAWTFKRGAAIDFGHEFRAESTANRRELKRVVFVGSRPINYSGPIEHDKLDLALVELGPPAANASQQQPFAIDLTVDWGEPGQEIYTIGYPARPQSGAYASSLLEQLFHSTYGYKRLAPGMVVAPNTGVFGWTVTHDATTLGGNSGSVVIVIGGEQRASGLHYGGRSVDPRENWGHMLSRVLDQTQRGSSQTLGDTLKSYGVPLVDSTARPETGPIEKPQEERSSNKPRGSEEPVLRVPGDGPPVRVRADLKWKTNLAAMARLVELAAEAVERPGSEPTTPAEDFDGRAGYNRAFLEGWPIELPRALGPAADDMLPLKRGGRGVELRYHNFSIILSKSRRMPMLTAVNIDGSQSQRLPRISTWSYDGRLDAEDQWGDELYYQNELDRGHMVRREDPVWGSQADAEEANRDTFHFTNSCPQMAGVNQVTWLGLENYILSHARADGMKVTVFTGPFFSDNDLPYRGALVPKAFWKVVAIVTDEGRPSATAYKVSQARELRELEFVYAGYKTYQISVQQVIDQAHIDFDSLVDYDGFSQHEHAHGETLVEQLDRFDQIRV